MPEQLRRLSSAIHNEIDQRIGGWLEQAEEHAKQHRDTIPLSVPSVLKASLQAEVDELHEMLASAHGRRLGPSGLIALTRLRDKVDQVADRCAIFWSQISLSAQPDVLRRLRAIAATSLSLAGAGGEMIEESIVMRRLYLLDHRMGVDGIFGAALDWRQLGPESGVGGAEAAVLSPAYLLSLRSLCDSGHVISRLSASQAKLYRGDEMLYNWASSELAQLCGNGWLKNFTALAYSTLRSCEQYEADRRDGLCGGSDCAGAH